MGGCSTDLPQVITAKGSSAAQLEIVCFQRAPLGAGPLNDGCKSRSLTCGTSARISANTACKLSSLSQKWTPVSSVTYLLTVQQDKHRLQRLGSAAGALAFNSGGVYCAKPVFISQTCGDSLFHHKKKNKGRERLAAGYSVPIYDLQKTLHLYNS